MERKIGEIFEHEGEWYQCVESPISICIDCDFIEYCQSYDGECSSTMREDAKSICFKKLEKVGEPFPFYGYIVQRYVGAKFPVVAPNEKRFINCNEINNTIEIEVKQDNQNTEDMEANEKTMPVPDGWEFDRIDESGNIVLKEKKKELPKTWLECVYSIDDVEMIEEDSEVHKCSISDYNKFFSKLKNLRKKADYSEILIERDEAKKAYDYADKLIYLLKTKFAI